MLAVAEWPTAQCSTNFFFAFKINQAISVRKMEKNQEIFFTEILVGNILKLTGNIF